METIEEHSDFMWNNKHLPALKSADEIKSGGSYDISERREQMLEELEKAHIYIEQLNNHIKELEKRNEINNGTTIRVLYTPEKFPRLNDFFLTIPPTHNLINCYRSLDI